MSRHEEDEDERYYVIEEKSGGGVGSFLLGAAHRCGDRAAARAAVRRGDASRHQAQGGRDHGRREGCCRRLERHASSTATPRRSGPSAPRIDSAKQAIDLKKHQASEAIRAGREAAAQAREELEARLAETKAGYQAGVDAARQARRSPGRSARPRDTEPGDSQLG